MSTTKTKPSAPASTTQAKAKSERLRKAAIAEITERLNGDAPPPTKAAAPKAKAPAKGAKAKPVGAKVAKPAKAKRVSLLDAAATVLVNAPKPMRAKELIEAITAKGLWSSPAGRTPHATLYAAMLREIGEKGAAARFRKAGRGLFAAPPHGKGA